MLVLADEVGVHHASRNERPNEVPDAVGEEVQESLGGAANANTCPFVGVDLPGDEEEVIADAVQYDAEEDHPVVRTGIAMRERKVPQRPRAHAHQHDPFDTESSQQKRQRQHEQQFRHLPEALDERWVLHADLGEERIGEAVVELQRDAEQEGADAEHQE